MNRKAASVVALGILASLALLAATGCTTLKCALCPGESPTLVEMDLVLKDGTLSVSLPEACIRNGGVIRWHLKVQGTFVPVSTWPKEWPPLPILSCPAGTDYCDLKLPKLPEAFAQGKPCVPYAGTLVTPDGKKYAFDPTFRILP